MGKKERDSSLDAVKGFTILIVMLGHVLVLNKINDPILYDWIKAVQMPLFMMVSGYLCGLSSKAQSPGDYGRMVGKRAVGYMLPFFAWTLVFHLDDFTWAFPGLSGAAGAGTVVSADAVYPDADGVYRSAFRGFGRTEEPGNGKAGFLAGVHCPGRRGVLSEYAWNPLVWAPSDENIYTLLYGGLCVRRVRGTSPPPY